MLGIVLGVSSLIATMALTRGMEEGTRIFMQQLGGLELVNIVYKEPSNRAFEFANLSPGRTLQDAETIRQSAQFISHVSPEISFGTAVSTEDGGNPDRRVVRGVYPDHFVIGMHQAAAGRFLTPLDIQRGTRCAVIGNTVARELWPGTTPKMLSGTLCLSTPVLFRSSVCFLITSAPSRPDSQSREAHVHSLGSLSSKK
jgi:putative ABC transport system permease protein